MVARLAKRSMDVMGAVVLLVLAAPLVIMAAISIRMLSPGPAFFRQPRVGRGGRQFIMLKLRSMHVNADDLLQLHLARLPQATEEWQRYGRLSHDPRVLPFVGRFLRTWSIDELPQLWNVLAGDMSLVGPRPLEITIAQQFRGPLMERRELVRPGMTGLWQVSGRSNLDLDVMVALDDRYVEQWSLWSDVVILGRTPAAIRSRRGAY
jgi:lipopolysaccharide/colanic/teichoic acid biosynthesis glycosyltransferase